jgi:hypothetical protein
MTLLARRALRCHRPFGIETRYELGRRTGAPPRTSASSRTTTTRPVPRPPDSRPTVVREHRGGRASLTERPLSAPPAPLPPLRPPRHSGRVSLHPLALHRNPHHREAALRSPRRHALGPGVVLSVQWTSPPDCPASRARACKLNARSTLAPVRSNPPVASSTRETSPNHRPISSSVRARSTGMPTRSAVTRLFRHQSSADRVAFDSHPSVP